jgi:hypothetical protein
MTVKNMLGEDPWTRPSTNLFTPACVTHVMYSLNSWDLPSVAGSPGGLPHLTHLLPSCTRYRYRDQKKPNDVGLLVLPACTHGASCSYRESRAFAQAAPWRIFRPLSALQPGRLVRVQRAGHNRGGRYLYEDAAPLRGRCYLEIPSSVLSTLV